MELFDGDPEFGNEKSARPPRTSRLRVVLSGRSPNAELRGNMPTGSRLGKQAAKSMILTEDGISLSCNASAAACSMAVSILLPTQTAPSAT
jgi:hypothetical protein